MMYQENQSTEKMTEISAKHWDFVTRENLTAKEAVAYLKNGMQVRSFQDNMAEVCGREDFEKTLVERLYELKQSVSEKKLQLDSVRKKIQNWTSGRNIPTEREEVFQICFAMDFNLEQSEKLLTRLTEQGIHYRNGREMIYAFCLKHHLGYDNALRLTDQFLKPKESQAKGQQDAYKDPVTQVMKAGFQQVKGEEDLFTFIMDHRMSMGNSHNTAYAYFSKMLSLLSGENLENEELYSLEYVADTYLRLNVPLDKKTAEYSNVQKVVKKYWPGARAIKGMKSRSEDVNRKTLLLLYIVTGGMMEEEFSEIDEENTDAGTFLEFHCKRMNKMLQECGMGRIDPRNMFDYLILYCLRPEEDIFMSDRMSALIAEVFDNVVL